MLAVEHLPLGCQRPHGRQLWGWLRLQGDLEAVQMVERLPLCCQVQDARHKLWA